MDPMGVDMFSPVFVEEELEDLIKGHLHRDVFCRDKVDHRPGRVECRPEKYHLVL